MTGVALEYYPGDGRRLFGVNPEFFIIALAWTAKPVIEQVVGLQFGEHPGPLAAAVLPVSWPPPALCCRTECFGAPPPRNAKTVTCPSQKASVVSAGYAFT